MNNSIKIKPFNKDDSNLCNIGTILASKYTSFLPKAGHLNYRRIEDKPNTFLISGIWVDESERGKGIATSMYKELCKIIRYCGDVEYVYGQTNNVTALRARVNVFGEPLSFVDDILVKIANTTQEAIEILEQRKGSIWVLSKTEGCK